MNFVGKKSCPNPEEIINGHVNLTTNICHLAHPPSSHVVQGTNKLVELLVTVYSWEKLLIGAIYCQNARKVLKFPRSHQLLRKLPQ